MKVAFRLCSINVLALDANEIHLPGSRAVRVDQQMHARKISVVCVQETRALQGQRMTDHYMVYGSGGDGKAGKQYLGCEIWLHKTIPILMDDGRSLKLCDFKVATIWADHRRLILRLTGPMSMSILIGSLHAPCASSKRSMNEIQSWWQKTADILAPFAQGHMFLGCDANSPLSSVANQHHGTNGAEETNPQGQAFEIFLHDLKLAVPATFSCRQGEHGAWKHPAGKLLRRDYVITTCQLLTAAARSQVLTDVDLGFSHVDHYPVQCDFEYLACTDVHRKRIRWDRIRMQDPVACRKFRDDIASLPIPRWDVDVDTRNSYFDHNVLALAKQHFAAGSNRRPDRPQLKEATVNLIAFKRQVLQMMRQTVGTEQDCLKSELREIEKQLRKMVCADQRHWYDEWLAQIDQSHRKHDVADVYKRLQRLGRKKKAGAAGPRPLPLLQDQNGTAIESYAQMQHVWCEQFAKIEAGIKVDQEDLLDVHMDGPRIHEDQIDISLVPGVQHIMGIVRAMRNGKVPGPNDILVETLKAGGQELARHLQPIMAKAILRTREPLEWKGGQLVPLFKGKGDPQCAGSYRSIFLSNSTAKVHHTWLRRSLEAAWLKSPQAIQLGGKKGAGTDLAHHLVQAVIAYARENSRALGMIFLDLRAAFYSVLRQAIFEDDLHDGLLCLAMERHGVMPEDWHDIRRQINEDNATQGLTKQVPQSVLTTKGARPGDPVGDILFNMLFAVILKQARQEFVQSTGYQWIGCPETAQNLHSLPEIPERAFLDLAYVDDAVFAFMSPHPQEIIGVTQTMAAIIHDTARMRGLEVNYEGGKTETLFRVAGKGAKKVKEQLWRTMQGQLPVVTEHATQVMRAVRSYKHLGTMIQDRPEK